MTSINPPEQISDEDEIGTSLIPISKPERIFYAFLILTLTVTSFIFSSLGILEPEWQSGNFSDYTRIMLTPSISIVFFPFLAYSIVCLILLASSPIQHAQNFIVRFGIYSGVILSLQYAIILSISFNFDFYYIYVAVGIAVPFIIRLLFMLAERKFGLKNAWIITSVLLVILVIIFPAAYMIFLYALLASGPYWCLIISTWVSIRLLKFYEFVEPHHPKQGIGIFAWLVGFFGAWQIAFFRTIEAYNALPKSPPDCYIATAAAKGHPWLVKSQIIVNSDGELMRVNAQMQYFKCAELILMAICPRIHRICRKVYDKIGKEFAQTLNVPILADVAYMILKPIEWIVRLVMMVLVRDVEKVTNRIYHSVQSQE